MIKITAIVLGKLKESYLKSAVEEYKKRISRFCELSIVELEPVKLPDSPSASQIAKALRDEAVLIEKHIPKQSYIISLCVEGKQLSSEEFAEKIEKTTNDGKNICFIIGSSFGLDENIKNRCDLKMSVSKMTFPHQLFRVILLEQIYRAFTITEGSSYHK